MGWFTSFWNSSIGQKFVMAVTGICLILFLVIHLIGNLMIFGGADAFNGYVGTLEHIKPLIRVIEFILALIFLFHILNGVSLWLANKKARPVGYKINGSSKNSSFFSRTMIVTGSITFIFLVVHLQTIWYKFNFSGGKEINLYEMVTDLFGYTWYSVFYLIAMILLGFHLNHGFQSAFQTFGWKHNKYTPLIEKTGTVYAIIMAVGFGSIPVYFLFGGGN
ncbi:MAG: succinate dehydrogenase cytochrome b subunit [Ignavibacteriales bacterium]|jgi:succinate dehydrogenase / fumarate reductase cytochrome b subunit|nr:succinate dehydrogenase cytochrome b subunit [Ignavibacteriaceae bacterium]NLH60877.1 succinate dehydrogenase cytochrome b subunit [Ignavibacteriales bacterium]HOJ18785.1 succinate dehydrogenase cytochrome b subunit [Ignavibacteriaceae bacterium]HPO56008.1 succinate dehydrogenase cytochrome b subunit [Ignavibacteriaceae bacterium]